MAQNGGVSKIDLAMKYLWDRERFGLQPGLERIHKLLAALDHPERQWPAVHVAGTNGKGSTAAMVESALRAQGYRTGLYTSPHMVDFRERIVVGGEMISEPDLIDIIEQVRKADESQSIAATFFEFVTVMALLYFAKQGVEIAVVEVGMGGALDATNVLRSELAVVTNVGLDHTEFLGTTKVEIAREKAGVFKGAGGAVTGETDPAVLVVLAAQAERLVEARDVFQLRLIKDGVSSQLVSVEGPWRGQVRLGLRGAHQMINAQVALTGLWMLREKGWDISWEAAKVGLESVQWPGRLQVIHEQPLMIADCAHNDDGMKALAAFLETRERFDTLLLGVKAGRSLDVFIEYVVSRFSVVVVSEAAYMAEGCERLAERLEEAGVDNVLMEKDISKAIARALSVTSREGFLLVTGSIYFVGDVLAQMR